MKKIAILLSLLLLVPALFIPGAAASGNGEQCICPARYSMLSEDIEGDNHIFELKVFFMNYGPYNASTVTADIETETCPGIVTIINGHVEMGDIPAGQGRWSKNPYIIDVYYPPGGSGHPEWHITWAVSYEDPYGVSQTLTDVPQSPTECVAGCGASAASVDLEPYLQAVEYRWASSVSPYYQFNYPSPGHFTGWMNVRIENLGGAAANYVTAHVIDAPPNTTVPDPDVWVGTITAAGGSAWSSDTDPTDPFSTDVNLLIKGVDPCAGITWRIHYKYWSYYDSDYIDDYVDVPQFPEGEGPCD